MSRHSVTVDNLSYTYPSRSEPTLKNICLKVPAGSVVLITGPTGCGKSTLMKCLSGIIPHETGGVMTGRVQIGSLYDTREANLHQVTKQVGLVFQNPDEQIFATLVRDEVAFGPENRGAAEDRIEHLVAEALASVGLSDAVHQRTDELSGGQKQRVVIAGQLAVGHEILCLDEPFSQMDPLGAAALRQVLKHLAASRHKTILLVEHRVHEVAELVDRVVIMENGEILMDREAATAFDDLSPFRRLGLNVPQSAHLFARLGLKQRPLNTQDALTLLRENGRPKTTRLLSPESKAGDSCQDKRYMRAKGAPPGSLFLNFAMERSCRGYSVSILPRDPGELSVVQQKAGRCGEGGATGICSTSPLSNPPQTAQRISSNPAIAIDDLSFNYDAAMPLFENLSLAICPGERVAVMGPNGCGKTTLLLLIAGLLKPRCGRMHYYGEAMKAERVLGRCVGFLLQNPDLMLIRDTVVEELKFPLHNSRIPREKVEEKVREALDVLMIAPLQNDYCFALSKGQRLRTAVASLLTLDPAIMLLDEPTTGQDRNNISEMMAHFERMGKTVVFSTHDLATAIHHATRLLVMKRGRIRYDGPVRGYFTPAAFDPECALVPTDVMKIAQGLGIEESVATVDDFMAVWSKA
jgi:energy-coupling factor transporter ATP-binding protein EcfA2